MPYATAAELVESTQRAIALPGGTLDDFDADELEGHIRDGFWNARLDGVLTGYTEADGVFTPEMGDIDAALLRFWTTYGILFNRFTDLDTLFRAQAGPVEFETQRSAQLLRDLLADLKARKKELLDRLAEDGRAPATYVGMIDAAAAALAQPWHTLSNHAANFDFAGDPNGV